MFLPRNGIGGKVLNGIVLAEQLHAEHGEDVDNDEEDEGEVTKGAQRGDNDAQQDLHRCPGLRQLQHSHLQ